MIEELGIIAGNRSYPIQLARAARKAGVKRIVVVAFDGETRPDLADYVDEMTWIRVGQMGKMIHVLESAGIKKAIMAGQIEPSNLFRLRPDFKALMILAKLKVRNAETIFGAIADELAKAGVELLNAMTFLDEDIVPEGHIVGPKLKARQWEDVAFGNKIAKEISRLDIGQTVVVRNGTVLAVEAFEGTNEAILRGGKLGRSGAMVVKVSKPNQDFRFDVPVAGEITMDIMLEAGIKVLALEAGCTLFVNKEEVFRIAEKRGISIVGIKS